MGLDSPDFYPSYSLMGVTSYFSFSRTFSKVAY